MKKRLLTLFIVLTQLFTVTVSADKTDVSAGNVVLEPSRYECIVKALGFFDKVEANDDVSFRDFCTFLFALKNTDISNYSDVDLMKAAAEREYIYSVSTVKQKADDSIYMGEAIYGAMNALGYSSLTESGEYLTRATSIGLTDGISFSNNDSVNGEQAFRLAYNMFDADYIVYSGQNPNGDIYESKKGIGILEHELGIYNGTGTVTANAKTGLYSDSAAAGDGKVKIDGVTYKIGETNADELLAYETEFYYKERKNDADTLLYIGVWNNSADIRKISGADIDTSKTTTTELVYYNGDKKRTAKIDRDAAVIYNGVACGKYTKDIFNVDSGDVTLIGSHAVIVNSYDTVWVNSLDMKTYKIYPFYGETVEPNVDKTKVINSAGDSQYLVDIARYDVISVKKSENSDYMTIIRSTDSVKGVLQSIKTKGDRSYAKINGQEYPITRAYLDSKHSGKTEMNVGMEAVFYLTAFGEVGAVGSVDTSSYYIGYVVGAKCSGMNDTVQLKMYNPDENKFEIIECANKVKFDGGSPTEGQSIKDKFNDTSGEFTSGDGFRRQLIGYKKNADGKITTIDLASDGNTGEKEQSLKLIFGSKDSDDKLCYRSYAACMGGKVLTGTAKVFQVSSKKDPYSEDDFSKLNLDDQGWYIVEAYSITQSGFVADYICVYTEGGAAVSSTRDFLVNDIVETLNSEGNVVTCLDGVLLGDGGVSSVSRTIEVENGCNVSELSEGDIVNVSLNFKDRVMNWKYVYDYSEGKFERDDFGEGIAWRGEEQRRILSKAYRKSGDNLEIVLGPNATSGKTHEFMIPKNFQGMVTYDKEARNPESRIFFGTMNDITTYEDMPGNESTILTYSFWSEPRWVVIYK